MASSQPPPSAYPLIAAITGLPRCSTMSKTCWPASANARALVGVCTASSLMSAPATNALSPAPVRITTRISPSSFRSSIARRSASSVSAFRAFRTLGRLNVTVATAPLRSRNRTSEAMDASEREGVHEPAEHGGRQHEAAEHHPAQPRLVAGIVFGDHRENERHKEREQRHEEQVALHFRPFATSYASMTTSRLSRPATIRNALPYS